MYHKEGRICEIVDPALGDDFSIVAVTALADIAADCTKIKARQRPEMTAVLTRLVELRRKLEHHSPEARPVIPRKDSGYGGAGLKFPKSDGRSIHLHSTSHAPPMSGDFMGR